MNGGLSMQIFRLGVLATCVSGCFSGPDIRPLEVGTGATTLTAQSSWTVKVDTAGTPEPGDDTLTIDGADQGVAGISVKQVSATNVKLDPSCTLNPVSGMGVIQEVSTFHIAQDTISF